MAEEAHAKRILVIEDEEPVRSVVAAFLEAADFAVTQAEDGKTGVERARAEPPDLIICDVNMPFLDGYGVLRALRQDSITAAIPFIFLTGMGELSDLRQGMNLGADDYLIKPFRRAELLRAIETRLAKQEAITRRFKHELKIAEEKLNHLLHYDTLTNLPNRLMLRDRMNQMVLQARPAQRIAAVSLQLDRFKRINDTLGHGAADLLLKSVGERLLSCLGKKDTVARLDADQFALILADVSSKLGASRMAQTLLDRLSAEPFIIQGAGIFTTASIGLAFYPEDGTDIDELVRNAETAMDQAKVAGGNSFQHYSREMVVRSADELALEAGLRYALERREFEVHYQPQIDLKRGNIVGTEALVRWRHPERGLVPPGQFISLAEETGLIIPLSEWVLHSACAQLMDWRQAGFQLVVAVNLSGHHFSQQNLSERLIQILRDTQLEPQFLDIEVTESILMKDMPMAVAMLNELKALGVQISIDDFGTGYSSLSYLKKFPFDTLKIDQIFVRNLTVDGKNAAITQAIIQMAHNLNLRVIAEGVETQAELDFLRANDCDQMQGYFFSRPVPASEFQKMLYSGKTLSAPSV